MPLYEYQCEVDGSRFEVIQKFSDAPLTTCPNCGGAVRKLLSSPAIQFKGSGWYITDYARKGSTGNSASDKPATSSTSSSSSSDAKSSSPSATPAPSTSSSPSGNTGSSS